MTFPFSVFGPSAMMGGGHVVPSLTFARRKARAVFLSLAMAARPRSDAAIVARRAAEDKLAASVAEVAARRRVHETALFESRTVGALGGARADAVGVHERRPRVCVCVCARSRARGDTGGQDRDAERGEGGGGRNGGAGGGAE